MIEFFIRCFSEIQDNSRWCKKLKIYAAQRFIIVGLANLMLPIYFLLTSRNGNNALKSTGGKRKLIVSVTTFPARIKHVWVVIECMLRQTYKPDKIILWLSDEQFSSLDILPARLLKLQKRGLEIRLCEGDLKSHKKYYYALQEFPNDDLITIDDDLIYSSKLIERLVALNKEHPDAICCDRAYEITFEGEIIGSYKKWNYIKHGSIPSFRVFQTSGGGTLYPPGSFTKEVLNRDVFMSICKNADDVWLNAMAKLNNTATVKTGSHTEVIPIKSSDTFSLSSTNVGCGENDLQLEKVQNHYNIKLG